MRGEHERHEHDPAREAERESRRAAREADRQARREQRRGRWLFGLGDLGFGGGDAGGGEVTEEVERRFAVGAPPRLHVRNVSGETQIAAGADGEIVVRARKRMRGWSEDRARRLLENVEIRMEQDGDAVSIEPRLFEQERGWLELFRGGRVTVDLDIRVPRETHVDADTVSGDVSLSGTRGTVALRSVSGEVTIADVQGPLRVRSVSGDICAREYAGQVEANSVSGDLSFERSRVRVAEIVTVSGDIDIDAVKTQGVDGRVRTVSGDAALGLLGADLEVEFRTLSGEASVDVPARVEREGRRDRRIVLGSGSGGGHLRVKTVSGDLRLRASRDGEPADTTADVEATVPMAPPPPAKDEAREILERLARGELSVDDAAAALDSTRSG